MGSKLDRWKKISSSSKESRPNPNKSAIVEELSRIPKTTAQSEQEAYEAQGENLASVGEQNKSDEEQQNENEPKEKTVLISSDNTTTESTEVQNTNNNPTPEEGLQNRSNNPTTNQTERKRNPPRNRGKKEEQAEPTSFISKVNSAVRNYIDNKQTKDDTHKKTSFLIRLDLLAKLDNFDNAHGGRIKGEFLNNLLENAFAELEEDPQWKSILNHNLEENIARIARKR